MNTGESASTPIATAATRSYNYRSLAVTDSYSIGSLNASAGQLLGGTARNMILISKSLVTVVFLITVLVIALVLVVGINQKPSLENVQDIVLFLRHGERQPFIPISGLGAYKSGELTPQGQKQITQMGSHLLQAYAPFVDAVPHARVVAANEERCIRSAELVVEIFGVQYQSNIIPYMEVKPTDPNYNEFVEQEKVFAAAIPDCMKNVSTTIIQRLNVSLPEEFKLLYGILIADSLDIVRGKGLSLPYGLDDLKCTNDGPFLTSEMYDALSKLATATFGKPSFQTFLDEVKQLRQSSDPSLTIFSFSDVHISGLLSMIDGSQKIDRPGFGAHFAIHFRGDYLDIYYSPSFDQSSRLWLSSAHTDKVLENIEKAVA